MFSSQLQKGETIHIPSSSLVSSNTKFVVACFRLLLCFDLVVSKLIVDDVGLIAMVCFKIDDAELCDEIEMSEGTKSGSELS